jgi:hypothetical protein
MSAGEYADTPPNEMVQLPQYTPVLVAYHKDKLEVIDERPFHSISIFFVFLFSRASFN